MEAYNRHNLDGKDGKGGDRGPLIGGMHSQFSIDVCVVKRTGCCMITAASLATLQLQLAKYMYASSPVTSQLDLVDKVITQK